MKIQGLSKKIDEKMIFEDIHIVLSTNQITGLIGRNGVGKTSLFRTIAGHYLPDSGDITICGGSLNNEPNLRQHIFYIDEQYSFFASQNLKAISAYYAVNYPDFDTEKFKSMLNDYKLANTLRYRSMSKGMQGLFKMILAVASNAKYLFLDEPFDGLDVIVRKNVIRLLLNHLSEKNVSVMISSHNLNELETIIDRALLMKETKITQDIRLEDFKTKARKLQLVFKEQETSSWLVENATSIRKEGRVLTVVFEQYTQEIEQKISEMQPILNEELPLTLEDFFEANLANDDDYQFLEQGV